MPVSRQFNRYTDIYEPGLDGVPAIERERIEYEAQLSSKLKDLSKGAREMLVLINRKYHRNTKECNAPRGEMRAWVSRSDIASELRRLKLYRYHLNQINKLVRFGLVEAARRARLNERINWAGEHVQTASGYELIYRPRPDVAAALKSIEARKRAATGAPKSVEPKPKPTRQDAQDLMIERYRKAYKPSLIDRLLDLIP